MFVARQSEVALLIPVDARSLIDVLNAAGGWLRAALQHARKERDRRAARVLHDAFVVVASMRAYDNAFRPLLGEVRAFSTKWEDERRRRLENDLRLFFDVEEILPRFRQAFQALQSSGWDGAGREALGRLIGTASTFGDEIVGPIWKEKENYAMRARIFSVLSFGQSPEEAEIVHEWAERIAAVLDRHLLAQADNAFGELRNAVLAAHDLPDPGYAVSLT
jgi:hypothetical protein